MGHRLKAKMMASGLTMAMNATAGNPCRARTWGQAADGGVYVGFHFDAHGPSHVGLGLEARGVFIDDTLNCDSHFQLFAGAVARIEVMGWQEARLTLGPVLGRSDGVLGYAGDIGAGVVLGERAELIVQAQADAHLAILNARLAYAIARDGSIGLGVRFPPLSLAGFCVVGRPLRRGGDRGPVAGAEIVCRKRTSSAAGDDSASLLAGRTWLRRACLEWASVPSFCELATQLATNGAPIGLLSRARDAAEDELRHAMISAALAKGLANSHQVSLDPPVRDRRAALPGRAGLVQLAVESFVDGCVGEGAAAAVAAAEADVAALPSICRVQSRIAEDESRHAELAWAILEWTLAVDPIGVRSALAALPSPSCESTVVPGPAASLAGYGILDQRRSIEVHRQHRARTRARLADRLRA